MGRRRMREGCRGKGKIAVIIMALASVLVVSLAATALAAPAGNELNKYAGVAQNPKLLPNAVANGSAAAINSSASRLLGQFPNLATAQMDLSAAAGTRTISGKVTNSSGQGIEGIYVGAISGNSVYGSAQTDSTGRYTIVDLDPREYTVLTANDLGYVDEWYNNDTYVTDPNGDVAKYVDVTLANASSINFSLVVGKTISGTVSAGTGGDISQIFVYAFGLDGTYLGGAQPDPATGAYIIRSLLAVPCHVCTGNDVGYIDEWYDDIPVLADVSGNSAVTIDLSTGNVTGKNFHLEVGRKIEGHVTASAGAARSPTSRFGCNLPTVPGSSTRRPTAPVPSPLAGFRPLSTTPTPRTTGDTSTNGMTMRGCPEIYSALEPRP